MLTTVPLAYEASQPYVQARPELPRFAVPPPNLDFVGGKPVVHLANAAPNIGISAEFGNPVFLRALISHGPHHLEHLGNSWRYEQRRAAQKILPYLLLGPGTVARDDNFVRTQGITLLVAVRSASAARLQSSLLNPSRFASSAGLQTLTLDLACPYDMITKLPRAIKTINDHLEQSCNSKLPTSLDDIPAKVLLFCESGNDRSATVVAAYLMVLYGLGPVEALQLVQSQRFCMAVQDDSKNMLQNFGDILRAQRDVAVEHNFNVQLPKLSMQHGISNGSAKIGKRSYDSANESDEDMEHRESDENDGMAEGRLGLAPFHDE